MTRPDPTIWQKVVVFASIALVFVMVVAALADKEESLPGQTPTAAAKAYPPHEVASASAAFVAAASERVELSRSLISWVSAALGIAPDTVAYQRMEKVRYGIMALERVQVPPELAADTESVEISDRLYDLTARIGAGMSHGMEYLDSRKTSDASNYQDRIGRSLAEIPEIKMKIAAVAAAHGVADAASQPAGKPLDSRDPGAPPATPATP